jgi:hypothetical protein
MARFDWEEAAKRDYVAQHGSVPFWSGLGHDETPEEKREIELRARLQALLEVVGDYAQLSQLDKQRFYHSFFTRLCNRFDDERDRVRSNTPRLLEAIDSYEKGLLSLLKGLRPRPETPLSGLDDRIS